MGAQSNVNVGGWKAQEETKLQCGAECCYDSGFNSGTNQAIEDLFSALTGKGTFLGGIKLEIMIIDRLMKIGVLRL